MQPEWRIRVFFASTEETLTAHTSEFEQLQTLSNRRPRHALLAAMAVAVLAAGAVLWHQDSNVAREQRRIPTSEPAWRHDSSLQGEFRAAESALEQARQQAERLHRQIAELDSEGQEQEAAPRRKPPRSRERERPRDRRPRAARPGPAPPARTARPSRPFRIDLGDCAGSPLGCTR